MNHLTDMKIAWDNLVRVCIYISNFLKEFWKGSETISLKGDGVKIFFILKMGYEIFSYGVKLDSITCRSFAFCLNWHRYNYDSFPYACGNGKIPFWFYLKPFRCSTKKFDWAVLESLSQLCTFEHSTKCINLSFDSHSFLECSCGPKSSAAFFLTNTGSKMPWKSVF